MAYRNYNNCFTEDTELHRMNNIIKKTNIKKCVVLSPESQNMNNRRNCLDNNIVFQKATTCMPSNNNYNTKQDRNKLPCGDSGKVIDDCCLYGEHKNFEKTVKSTHHVMPMQIHHGGDKHRILVEGLNGCNLRLCDVMRQIEKELKIPADKQRIFYKGIELQKFASSDLETLKVFQNSMLRVSGESDNENWIENFFPFH
jgi:hypothetical protein